MLALKIKNTFIDLEPGTKVPITLTNPVFDVENIERVFAFPFSIPLTAKNKKLFGYRNRLDVKSKVKRYAAEMWLGGELFEAGVVEVQSANRGKMSIVFKNNSIRLKERMSKVSLNDLSLPESFTTPFAPIYDISLTIPVNPDDTATGIGINGHIFDGSTLFFPEFVNLINQTFPGLASVGSGDPGTLVLTLDTSQAEITEILLRPALYEVPPPSVHTYFDTITSNYGDEITRVNSDFNTHATLLEAGNGTHVFAPVYTPNIYDGKNPSFKKYINGKDAFNDYFTQDALIDLENVPDWNYSWSPQVFLTAVLDAIADYFDIQFTGVFDTDADLQKLVIFSNRLIDSLTTPEHHIGDVESTQGVNIPATSYDLSDHLPDISCFDVLEYLRSNFAFFYRFKDSKLDIQTRKSKINIAEKDWTRYFEPDYNKDIRDSEEYSLNYDRYGDETLKSGQLEDTDGGTDAKEYTAKWWTLFNAMRENSGSVNRTWKISEYNGKGTSQDAGIKEDQDPILMFYHGLHGDNQDFNYPFLSHSNTDFAGNEISAYSLDWDGPSGRFEQFWKEIIKLETEGQEIEKVARIPLHVIRELKRTWNAKVGIYSSDGQLSGFVKSVSFQAGERGPGVVRIKFIKN